MINVIQWSSTYTYTKWFFFYTRCDQYSLMRFILVSHFNKILFMLPKIILLRNELYKIKFHNEESGPSRCLFDFACLYLWEKQLEKRNKTFSFVRIVDQFFSGLYSKNWFIFYKLSSIKLSWLNFWKVTTIYPNSSHFAVSVNNTTKNNDK